VFPIVEPIEIIFIKTSEILFKTLFTPSCALPYWPYRPTSGVIELGLFLTANYRRVDPYGN